MVALIRAAVCVCGWVDVQLSIRCSFPTRRMVALKRAVLREPTSFLNIVFHPLNMATFIVPNGPFLIIASIYISHELSHRYQLF